MKVLLVCFGNICRSPTAEGVLRTIAQREAPYLITHIDSAGTADYHTGNAPDHRSVAAAARRGYDIAGLRARQVCREDFASFDLLLAMDCSNLAALRQLTKSKPDAEKIRLFLSYSPAADSAEVPDPYYGGPADFERVIDLCELAARGLISDLGKLRR